MRAWSVDGLLTWQKRMVMHDRERPSRESPVHWDGQVWREGSTWFQLIGGAAGGRGAAHLWTSPDLDRWTYRKPIYSGGPGSFWELPYLIRFGSRAALFIGVPGNPYWIGTYDPQAMEFTPDDPERPRHFDHGTYYSFNPNLLDEKGPGGTPRRIVQGWVTGGASPTEPSRGAPALGRHRGPAGGGELSSRSSRRCAGDRRDLRSDRDERRPARPQGARLRRRPRVHAGLVRGRDEPLRRGEPRRPARSAGGTRDHPARVCGSVDPGGLRGRRRLHRPHVPRRPVRRDHVAETCGGLRTPTSSTSKNSSFSKPNMPATMLDGKTSILVLRSRTFAL